MDIGFWMVISTLVTMLPPIISRQLETLVNKIIEIALYLLKRDKNYKGCVQIVYESTTSDYGTMCTENIVYKSLLYHMFVADCTIRCLRQGTSGVHIFRQKYENDVIKKNLNLILCDNKPIVIDKKNNIIIETAIEKFTAGKDTKVSNNIITISSSILTTKNLLDLLSEYQNAYLLYLKQYDTTMTQQYIKLCGYTNITKKVNDENVTNKSEIWKRRDFRSFKTFNNVFFPQKEIVLQQLNTFLQNEEEYQRRGIAYTISILLYGPPGCGKTSFIKALANKLNRHIVDINLSTITTCDEFERVFNDDFIDDTFIPIDKRIIVLEDMDCMGKILNSRHEECPDKKTDIDDDDDIKNLIVKEMLRPRKYKDYEKDDAMNLSCFLNVTDGTYEHRGRIIVATTNHLEKLDPAVLRRFDIKVELSYLTQETAQQIVNNYYNTCINLNKITPNYWTGSALTQLCQEKSDVFLLEDL